MFLDGDTKSVNPEDSNAFTYVMLFSICLGIVASIGYHLLVKFPDDHKKVADQDTNSNTTSMDWSWFKEYQLYQIGFVYMATRLFVNLSQSYIPLFLQVIADFFKNHEIDMVIFIQLVKIGSMLKSTFYKVIFFRMG